VNNSIEYKSGSLNGRMNHQIIQGLLKFIL
jgi:hypothetical protein